MKNRILLALSFIAVFVFAAWERFYRLSEMGLDGSDIFFYWEMARQYASGNFVVNEHYRPLAYGLYALAMKIGGVNDYSIKYLNASLDLINGLLAAYIVFRVSNRAWLGLLGAVLYFALVEPVVQARMELLHIPSTTPFLLSFVFLEKATRQADQPWVRWSILLAVSGLFLGLGANIHPTVALMGPGAVFSIWWWSFTRESEIARRMLVGAATFTVGFALPFLAAGLFMNVGESIATNRGAQTQSLSHLPANVMWALQNFIPEISSTALGLLFAFAAAYAMGSDRLRRRPFAWTAILILAFTYMTVYVVFVPKYRLTRTLLPLMPLILAFVALIGWDLLRRQKQILQVAGLGLLTLGLAISFRSHIPYPYSTTALQKPTVYLEAKSALGEVSADRKVIVAPLIVYHDRTPFAQSLYLGEHAKYLIHAPVEKPESWIKEQKVSHVVFFKENWDYRVMNDEQLDARSFRKRVPAYFNWSPEKYEAGKELEFWRDSLMKWGFELVAESNRFVIWRKP